MWIPSLSAAYLNTAEWEALLDGRVGRCLMVVSGSEWCSMRGDDDDPVRTDRPVWLASAPGGRGGGSERRNRRPNGVSVEWIGAGFQALHGGSQPTDGELSDVR